MKINLSKFKTKTVCIFLMCCIGMSSALFSSCNKEKEEKLDGTTWICSFRGYECKTNLTLIFSTNSIANLFIKESCNDGYYDSESLTGTYTYNKPSITLVIDGDTFIGTVNNNTMTMIIEGETIIFTKQG